MLVSRQGKTHSIKTNDCKRSIIKKESNTFRKKDIGQLEYPVIRTMFGSRQSARPQQDLVNISLAQQIKRCKLYECLYNK